ncbi:MAG: hypothetical protein WD063_01385 [Pirellulales bacterium]
MFDVTLIAADWWSWLIPAVFIIVYLVNHLLTGKAEGAKQRDAAARRRGGAGERPLRPQQAPQQGGQSQLNAEIDQFLKRANERRMEKARRETPAAGAPKPPLAPPPQPLREQPLEIEPLEHHGFDAVEESVKQHLGNRGFEQRAEHLADDIARAEGDMERHLQQAFGHRVGTLGSVDPVAPTTPVTDVRPSTADDRLAAAKALAGLLANQENIRQAVVLKEILERPIDRW